MNVSDQSALRLLKAFARFEYALKCFPEFTNGEPGEVPDVQWTAYFPVARRRVEESVRPEDRAVLLGTHANDPPPMKMQLDQQRRVIFVERPLVGPVGDRLIEAARRVRNNVVHGGKQHPHQERYPGHDQRLVDAATNIIYLAATAQADVEQLVFAE